MSRATLLARVRGRPAFWALAGVALLASHDLTFLVQLGPGEALASALRQAGHGYWGPASLALAVIGLLALAIALLRLRGLRRRAAALGAPTTAGPRPFGARWLSAWVRLATVVAIGFAIQENVEHVIVHGHAPGLGALLGPEHPLVLPIIGVLTAAFAVVAAALGHVETALLARIAAALRRRFAAPPRRIARPPSRLLVTLGSPLTRAGAGRAPPGTLVSAT
jgi:hypothetical protein